MKYVVSYESVPDFESLAEEHFPAHLEHLDRFYKRGVMLAMGPLQEPYNGEGLGVFTTQEAAEEFVANDPFVVHGVVQTHRIRAWQENFLPDPDPAG
jgi:uncharacterized protein YciI